MPLKVSPAHKVTVAHAEMTVARVAALQVLLVLAVVIVAARRAVVAVMVAVLQLRPQPRHKKLLLFQLTPFYRT